MCGEAGPLHAKLGTSFTDYRTLAHIDGSRLCAACSWTYGGKPPHTLRMWSIVARLDRPAPRVQLGDKAKPHATGEYLLLTNRKDMRWAASTLADPPVDGSPWLVAVAESGQKHTAPFTAVNHGSGQWTVRLDSTDITSSPGEWRTVLSRSAALRRAGFSGAAIETGQPSIVALTGEGLTAWREHYQPHLAAYAGTPLLHLANLMITKETLDDFIRQYPTG